MLLTSASGRGSACTAALFLLYITFRANAASAGQGRAPRHLLGATLQYPGLELANTDRQSAQPLEPAAQPKALSSADRNSSSRTSNVRGFNSSTPTTDNPGPAAPAGAASSSAPAPPPDSSSPQDPAAWQRRTMQLPPHVYLISFVMLLAIMAALLSCHCYRMCRIARRMRQAAELGITLSPAGATLNKRTPQSVIEALPVSKYSTVHSSKLSRTASQTVPRSPASATAAAATGAAAAPGCGSSNCTAVQQAQVEASSSNVFLAAALQIREQVARQTGIATLPANSSSSSTAGAPAPTTGVSNSSSSSMQPPEITPDGSSPANAAAAVSAGTKAASLDPTGSNSTQQAAAQLPAPTAAVTDAGPALLASTSTVKRSAAAAATAVGAGASSSAAVAAHNVGSSGGSVHGAGVGVGGVSSSSSGAEPCAICFDEFAADDDVKQLPCGHYFHPGCIDEWLVRDITCPLCKGMVLDDALIEQQEMMAVALQGSLLTTPPSIARTMRIHSAPVGGGLQLQGPADREPEDVPARRSRVRFGRRSQPADAGVAGSSGASTGGQQAAGRGDGSAAASSRSRPRSNAATADEMFDLLHMVMLGIPRISVAHTASASAGAAPTRQQQAQPQLQQQQQEHEAAGAADRGSGRMDSRRRAFGLFPRRDRQDTASTPADVELGTGGSRATSSVAARSNS